MRADAAGPRVQRGPERFVGRRSAGRSSYLMLVLLKVTLESGALLHQPLFGVAKICAVTVLPFPRPPVYFVTSLALSAVAVAPVTVNVFETVDF